MSNIQVKRETITPVRARQLLALTEQDQKFNNRTPKGVEMYASIMQSGKWFADTLETIKVDTDGVVIDGQNRLHAVAKADRPIVLWMAYNVPRDAFQYLDQGTPRSSSNILEIKGYPDYQTLATVFRYVHCESVSGHPLVTPRGGEKLTSGLMIEWVEHNRPDLKVKWLSVRNKIRKAHQACEKATTVPVLFYLYDLFSREDKELADKWLDWTADSLDHIREPHNSAFHYFVKYIRDRLAAMQAMETNERSSCGHRKTIKAGQFMWKTVKEDFHFKTYKNFARKLEDFAEL